VGSFDQEKGVADDGQAAEEHGGGLPVFYGQCGPADIYLKHLTLSG